MFIYNEEIFSLELIKTMKQFNLARYKVSLNPASLKECEWCELCSLLSTITSLHSREHAGQSEINALSLGNTQELVSLIVLSSADNCFAAVPQNDKTMSL